MSAKQGLRVVVLMAVLWWAGVCRAGELPVECFFKEFAFSNAKLSTGGKYLAALSSEGTNSVLLTVDLATFQSQVACAGAVRDYNWVSDDRLIVQGGGVHLGGVFAVDRNGANMKMLLEPAIAQAARRWVRIYHLLEPSSKSFPFILVESAELDLLAGPKIQTPKIRRFKAAKDLGTTVWNQYLVVSELNGVTYLNEGNGPATPR